MIFVISKAKIQSKYLSFIAGFGFGFGWDFLKNLKFFGGAMLEFLFTDIHKAGRNTDARSYAQCICT